MLFSEALQHCWLLYCSTWKEQWNKLCNTHTHKHTGNKFILFSKAQNGVTAVTADLYNWTLGNCLREHTYTHTHTLEHSCCLPAVLQAEDGRVVEVWGQSSSSTLLKFVIFSVVCVCVCLLSDRICVCASFLEEQRICSLWAPHLTHAFIRSLIAGHQFCNVASNLGVNNLETCSLKWRVLAQMRCPVSGGAETQVGQYISVTR